LDELEEPSHFDLNPLIYLRVARPLKSDAQLDMLALDQFYEKTKKEGLNFNITPDFGFNEKAQ
jgi:hypothetical protein